VSPALPRWCPPPPSARRSTGTPSASASRTRAGVEKFKEAKVEDPATHFKGKTVRATGKVTLYRKRPQIVIEEPAQLVAVKKD
jgi:DNA/RNA endonuclease YhcR with UshA esterase domain